jgi:uncharacterized membrane protein YphA (DoxX/SURF4 family)
MLSLFPSLLTYEQVAPFLLRITLGCVLIFWSYGKLRSRKNTGMTIVGTVDGIIGVLLVIGLYVQVAVLVSAVILFFRIIKKIQTRSLFTDGVNYYFILFIISLSLLVLGPGILAFDLPL